MASRAVSPSRAPARTASPQGRLAMLWVAVKAAMRRAAVLMLAMLLISLAGLLVTLLLTYSPLDPSLNTVTGRTATNALGVIGSYLADMLLQLVGWSALLFAPVIAIAGLRLVQRQDFARRRAVLATSGGIIALAAALGAIGLGGGPAPAGAGGLVGLLAEKAALALGETPLFEGVSVGWLAAVLLVPAGLALVGWGTGVGWDDVSRVSDLFSAKREAETPLAVAPRAERRARAETRSDDTIAIADEPAAPRTLVVEPQNGPAPGKRVQKERQSALDLGDSAILPSLSLLKPPPALPTRRIDAASLEQNARLLEGVLEDFGVRGRIGEVRPGPVVTMYELEPAPGIKASRVIGLADDIARSMSALSARVAVVPGKNVIGIELPNLMREMVSLSELLGSEAFESRSAVLPLVLGKDIAGEPVIADLAPMPHLLIAGTTGSGKSVGLNAMILSLLYRLTPAQCRLIMIDPKMLELSIYDGIPHLLAPVVTDPPKAIRALKWAVEQMEDRYRQMSAINVRSLANFNQKVLESKAAGKPFVRRVQTGWDPDTELPIIEEEILEFETMPLIVVVVDELADLMMTAGKEVEFLIQRLAQKARAAGIHLIMATQRPSVDVITGVIKANLPTRISFQVTSKIDSRTILGEQGAEQLLGKGDMLWMSGGKQVVRVHGPFVSDDEVEAVADHWRRQGMPAYVNAVTEEPADSDGQWGSDADGTGGRGAASEDKADTYAQAIDIIARAQKASTSYLQRTLNVGYNNAAKIIERMEADGFVSKADHVGRREVLIDENGQRR
jgi:DNA segregation ATPase FtsK/SpoIIIE, S-DNA-T family